MQKGKASIIFEEPPCIYSAAAIVGQKEGEGPLGACFDQVEADPMFGQANWEAAESELQRRTALCNMEKSGISREKIRYLFGGDLLGQDCGYLFWRIRAGNSSVWPLWGLLYHGRGFKPFSYDGGRRLCRLRHGYGVQPFCQRGEAVSVSAGLWKSEAVFFYLDSDGMRFCAGGEKGAQR